MPEPCKHPFTQWDCDVLFCSDCGERIPDMERIAQCEEDQEMEHLNRELEPEPTAE